MCYLALSQKGPDQTHYMKLYQWCYLRFVLLQLGCSPDEFVVVNHRARYSATVARKFGRTIMNGLRRNRIVELKNSSFLHNEIPIVPSSKRMLQKIDNEKKSWLLWWANYFIKSGGFDQWLLP